MLNIHSGPCPSAFLSLMSLSRLRHSRTDLANIKCSSRLLMTFQNVALEVECFEALSFGARHSLLLMDWLFAFGETLWV